MDGKFAADFARIIKPACDTCKHRSQVLPGICLAFPEGIPYEILVGENDHTALVKGDHGIRYEACQKN